MGEGITINEKYLDTKVFTEYDGTLVKKLNIDPLGFQVVWTYLGQRIFQNKTTSVALDIRSYNINLFNQFIIYQILFETDSLDINRLITNEISRREKIDKLLIVLENMLTWSWFKNQDKWGDSKLGLLGTSKALFKWGEPKELNKLEIDLNASLENIQVLKNQKSLGVNGRYKGPFVSMKFFDSQFSKASYMGNEELWKKVKEIVTNKDLPFSSLYVEVMNFFKNYPDNKCLDEYLVEQFEKTFKDPKLIVESTKEFWLDNLGLSSCEAKEIYDVDMHEKTTQDIFIEASKKLESNLFFDIINIEPQLVYINLLFDYLLLQDGRNITDLEIRYLEILEEFEWLESSKDNKLPKYRMDGLAGIKRDYKTLIEYHRKIMKSRAQTPWIELVEKDRIRVNITKNIKLDEIEKKLENGLNNEWIHDYYITSIRNIKKGLGG